MNRKAICTVLMLLVALTLLLTGLVGCKKDDSPPTITISGRVIWGGHGSAVADATVQIGTVSTKTTVNGTFQLQFTNPPATGVTGTLTVTHPQCVAFSQSVNAADNLTLSDIFVTRLNYVDNVNGDDTTADGTAGKPYKTITAALTDNGWVNVLLAEGIYQADETFPLRLGENDTLCGSLTGGTTIKANGQAINVVGHGVNINNIIFQEQDFNRYFYAICLGTPGLPASLTVDRCTFNGWYRAIFAGIEANLDICDSVISNNYRGIQFYGSAGKHFTIHGSTISNNDIGIEIEDSAAIDFGTSAIPGENDFRSNSSYMLWDYRPVNCGAIYAVGNTWNSATMPAVADKDTPGGGTDFHIQNSGNTIIFSEE